MMSIWENGGSRTDVVLREDAQIADALADPVAAVYLTEKLEQPVG